MGRDSELIISFYGNGNGMVEWLIYDNEGSIWKSSDYERSREKGLQFETSMIQISIHKCKGTVTV